MDILDIVMIIMYSAALIFLLRMVAVNIAGNGTSGERTDAVFSSVGTEAGSFAVIVCCRNEERVIGRLLTELNAQDHRDHRVFVVAHNCTDNTAVIANAHGADVIEYNAPDRRRKSDALDRAMEYIRINYADQFDYVAVFDADSVPNRNFLSALSRAMSTGCDVASGVYDSLNYGSTIISRLCSGLYMMLMKYDSLASHRRGLPVNIYGSGFAVRYEMVRDGWNTRTLVEDFEFVVREVLNGKKFIFVPDAVFKAEMPCSLPDALGQRLRWAVGDRQCSRLYRREYLRRLRHPSREIVKQFIDMELNGFCLVTMLSLILIIIKASLTGSLRMWVFFLAAELILLYCILLIMSVDTFRYAGKKVGSELGAILLMPLWILVSVLCGALSFFIRDVDWKVTEHKGVELE